MLGPHRWPAQVRTRFLLHPGIRSTEIMQSGQRSIFELDYRVVLTHLGGALVVLTTIHAQDFEDEAGDKAIGRKTLPIVSPYWSRCTMFIGMTTWSVALSTFWTFKLFQSSMFVGFGIIVGARYLVFHGQRENKRSYLLYNVRFAATYML